MHQKYIQDIKIGDVFFKDISTRMLKTEFKYGFNCFNLKSGKYEFLPDFTKVYVL